VNWLRDGAQRLAEYVHKRARGPYVVLILSDGVRTKVGTRVPSREFLERLLKGVVAELAAPDAQIVDRSRRAPS
jgi:hypothetical protein